MNKAEKYSMMFGFMYVSAMSMYMIKTQNDFRNQMKKQYPTIVNALQDPQTPKQK